MPVGGEPLLWGLLGWVVLPLWLLSGLADYICHARMDLAHTSGRHESALHLVQLAEIGLPLLAFLFLDVTATTLLLMAAGVVAHTATSWRDIRYADATRIVPPFEQYVHSFLNVLPWTALALVAVLHWPVVARLLDPGAGADWALRWRVPPFPPAVIAAVLLGSLVLVILPGAWEFLRANRAARGPR
jgi:hypothetical protein